MKVAIHAVGRMKSGPERELADRYLDRFTRAGPSLGLEFAGLTEIAEGRGADAAARRSEESAALLSVLPAGSALILLDERGRNFSSPDFAEALGRLRDVGTRHAIFALGGPDGHEPAMRQRAAIVLSFGALTWPHQLARIMLAEQLYRAATILSGHPYHRA